MNGTTPAPSNQAGTVRRVRPEPELFAAIDGSMWNVLTPQTPDSAGRAAQVHIDTL